MKIMRTVCVGLMSVILTCFSTSSFAGLMDAFNKASQAVSTVENAKYTAQRAGAIVPKSNKPKPAKVEVRSSGSMAAKDRAAIEKAKKELTAAEVSHKKWVAADPSVTLKE